MTVKALARAMNIDVGKFFFYINLFDSFGIDHVYDCLIHIKNGDQYSSDNQGLWTYIKHFNKNKIF